MTARKPPRHLVASGDYLGFYYVATSTKRGRLTKCALYADETFPTPSATVWLKPHEMQKEEGESIL
jgi:hypothetical protein